MIPIPKTKREWTGLRCRLKSEARSRHLAAPAGTIVTVTDGGVVSWFEGEPCEHCGVRLRMSARGNLASFLEPIERAFECPPPVTRKRP